MASNADELIIRHIPASQRKGCCSSWGGSTVAEWNLPKKWRSTSDQGVRFHLTESSGMPVLDTTSGATTPTREYFCAQSSMDSNGGSPFSRTSGFNTTNHGVWQCWKARLW